MKTDLLKVPNIGKNIKADLLKMGIICLEDLKGQDPEELYKKDCLIKGYKEDKCQLYVFRAIVYYADNEKHNKEKKKWWYRKDKKYPEK